MMVPKAARQENTCLDRGKLGSVFELLAHSFIHSLLTTSLSVIIELQDDDKTINSYGPFLVELMVSSAK